MTAAHWTLLIAIPAATWAVILAGVFGVLP